MLSRLDATGTQWLLEITLKSSLLLGLSWTICANLRRSPALARYLLWSATLVGILLVPVVSGFIPGLRLPLLPGFESTDEAAQLAPLSSLSSPVDSGLSESPLDPASSETDLAALQNLGSPNPIHGILFGIWLAGVFAVLAWLTAGVWLANRFVKTATPLTGGVWKRLLNQAQRKMALSGRIRVLKNDTVPTPMTWGVFRPVVLMPAEARSWSGERQKIVLLHELVHVKRYDWLFLILGQVSCALYWFNPLVWIASSRMALEREQACDDDVIALGTKPSTYAKHLIDVARSLRSRTPLQVTTLTMSRSRLEERVSSILRKQRRPRRQDALPTILTMASLIFALALVHPWIDPAPRDELRASGSESLAGEPGSSAERDPGESASGESGSEGGDPTSSAGEESSGEPGEPDPESSANPGGAMEAGTSEEGDAEGTEGREETPSSAAVSRENAEENGREEEEDERERAAMDRVRRLVEDEEWDDAIKVLRIVLRNNLLNAEAWYYLAHSLYMQEDFDRALEVFKKATQFPEVRGNAHYSIACILSVRGEVDEALDHLFSAVEAGFHQWEWIALDEDLAAVRHSPRYEKLERLRPEASGEEE